MSLVKVSPHIHDSISTDKAMLCVTLALLPSAIWGVLQFGYRALIVLVVSIVSSMLTEKLLNLISKEHTLLDFSALVTGLLIGMNMPPTVPLYIPVLASAFAIGVVKWTFGGLGCNWANPAICGRVFVFFSFSSSISRFILPRALSSGVELVTSATPLSLIKMSGASGLTSFDILSSAGVPISTLAEKLALRFNLNPYTVDAFFGFQSGCIGEVSALLLILGGLFLLWERIITWHIPVVYLGSFALLSFIFGGLESGMGFFKGEIFYPLLSGGVLLGAVFMATDWVTSPTTKKGEIIYALGCGIFTFIFRTFSSMSGGVSLAILLMNMATPLIDRLVKPKKFGYVKPVREGKK